jgi:hypothetical protein
MHASMPRFTPIGLIALGAQWVLPGNHSAAASAHPNEAGAVENVKVLLQLENSPIPDIRTLVDSLPFPAGSIATARALLQLDEPEMAGRLLDGAIDIAQRDPAKVGLEALMNAKRQIARQG